MKKIIISLLIILTLLTCANPVQAALKFSDVQSGISTTAGQAGVSTTDWQSIAITLIKAFLGVVGALFVVMIIYGGFMYMVSSGNETNIKKAKKIIISAIIGIIIITLAYAIASFISSALEPTAQTTPPAITNP